MKPWSDPAGGSRLAYLDNLRIFLTILVIFHHASIAFGGGGSWPVEDPKEDLLTSVILNFFTAVNQTYFMSAFFLLAGYFTPRSLEKKGARPYLLDRLVRLGIPLLVYTTLIINLNAFLVQVVWLKQPFSWIVEYNPGHLWFLQALLLFAVIYAVYRHFSDREPAKKRFQIYPERFPPNQAMILSIVVLAALSFVVRIFIPVGEWIGGIQPAHFVHYIFCFFIGISAYRGEWLSRLEGRQAKPWGIVALVMLPTFFVFAILGGALEGEAGVAKFLGGITWQNLIYAIWESIMLIAALTFLLYFFRERVSRAGKLLITMAASVYTVYIIHQTIVIAADIIFIQTNLPLFVKFLLVGIISVPVCFWLAGLIRKIPYTDRVVG